MTTLEHAEGIARKFTTEFIHKYMVGDSEHGGFLWEKPGAIRMAKDEHLDLTSYLDVIESQARSALDYLINGDVESAKFTLEKLLGDPVDK